MVQSIGEPTAPSSTIASAPTSVRTRIGGIDIARGVAIVGMVMVHIGPQEVSGDSLLAVGYRSPHGRASILFIVLAGIGVSLLAGDRSDTRVRGATMRLWWRALILLPIGLVLQQLPTNVAVILQYYAFYFVVASLLLHLGDRALLAVAAASATLGPALLVWMHQVVPDWFQPGVPAWYDAGRIVRDVTLTGYYPVVVWTAPLAVGMWLGRRPISTPAMARLLLLGGAVVTAVGFVMSDVAVALLGTATSEGDWRQLVAIEPHNEMPLWVLTSGAIAVAIIGGCVLIGQRMPRVSWPLVAFGQLAFTTYVLHLLVIAVAPQWLERDELLTAWVSVARFTIVSVAIAAAYRMVAARGPFEMLLRLPLRRPR